MIEKSMLLEATVDNLAKANAFLESVFEEAGVPLKVQLKVNVAFEELYVNVCHYAYTDKGDIDITCAATDDLIRITLVDSGMPFNPLKKEDPNTKAPIEERKIGGLGIFMVKKSMDEFLYEYLNGKNIVTIIQRY